MDMHDKTESTPIPHLAQRSTATDKALEGKDKEVLLSVEAGGCAPPIFVVLSSDRQTSPTPGGRAD